eukprot:365775-Chlamydomonas_euryale.AAC.14
MVPQQLQQLCRCLVSALVQQQHGGHRVRHGVRGVTGDAARPPLQPVEVDLRRERVSGQVGLREGRATLQPVELDLRRERVCSSSQCKLCTQRCSQCKSICAVSASVREAGRGMEGKCCSQCRVSCASRVVSSRATKVHASLCGRASSSCYQAGQANTRKQARRQARKQESKECRRQIMQTAQTGN